MFKAIAFGIATGAGIQGFRQWPADGPVTLDAAVLLLVLGVLCAYWGGRWHGRGRGNATAVAVASAEATATAAALQNVNVFVSPAQADNARAHWVQNVPTADTPWLGGPRAQITADDLDGLEVAELIEETETA